MIDAQETRQGNQTRLAQCSTWYDRALPTLSPETSRAVGFSLNSGMPLALSFFLSGRLLFLPSTLLVPHSSPAGIENEYIPFDLGPVL